MGCEGCESEKLVTQVHQARVPMKSSLIWKPCSPGLIH